MEKLPVWAIVTSVVAIPSALVVVEELLKLIFRRGDELHATGAFATGTPTASVTLTAMVELGVGLARLMSLTIGCPTMPAILAGRVQTLNACPLPTRYR